MPIEVDHRSMLSLEEFNRGYASTSRPVILTDAIDRWPATRTWSLDYFARAFPGKHVRFDGRSWELADFIAELGASRSAGAVVPYLKEVKLAEQFPELWQDIGEMAPAAGNRLSSGLLPRSMRIDRGTVALFIGAKGSGFRTLHWDYSYLHVFISQVVGSKDAILFAPDDASFLYPHPERSNQSLIPDPFDVDLDVFPLFAQAQPTRLTIEQGETLFLPAGWWHATRINEPSIAIAESTLDAFNWTLRKNWYLKEFARAKVPAAKLMALNLYLSLIEFML